MVNILKGIGAIAKKRPLTTAVGAGALGYGAYKALSPEDPAAEAPAAIPSDFSTPGVVPQESSKQTSATSTSRQTTSKEGPIQQVAAPKNPILKQLDIVKPGDEAARLKELFDAQRNPEEKKIFSEQKKQIQDQLAELKTQYGSARAAAKDKGEQDAVTARWAQAAEGLMNAAITIYAAQQGLAKGQNIAGNLQLTRNDWNAEINASLKRAAEERASLFQEERAYAGDLEKTGAELTRGEERAQDKESQAVRDVKQIQAQRDRDIQQENFRREGTNVSTQNTAAEKASQNAFEAAKFNAAQANADRPSTTVQETTRSGTEEGERAGGNSVVAQKAAQDKQKAFAELKGALARLNAANGDKVALDEVTKQATLLGIPQAEVDQLIKETTGEGLFNLSEPEKVNTVLKKYQPGQAQVGQASAVSAVPAATVTVISSQGKEITIPADKLEAARKTDPGLRIKGQ